MKGVTEYINFRNANPIPDVMTILSGIGSPQEMVHTDEKWHTENFMPGVTPAPEEGLLEQGKRRRTGHGAARGGKAADKLLQLPAALRGPCLLPGIPLVHDEMLREAHLLHGGLCRRPGLQLQDPAKGHGVWGRLVLDPADPGLRRRASSRPAF